MTELLSQRILFSLHRNDKLNLHNAQIIIHILLKRIFFVKVISFLKILDSLSGPQASRSEKHNNYNYCQLGLTFGCLLHWVHW